VTTDTAPSETQPALKQVDGELQLTLPPPAASEHLEVLVGEWAGHYQAAGQEFEAKAENRWVFNHQFVRGLNQTRGPLGLTESQEMWVPTPEAGVYKLYFFDSFAGHGVALARWTGSGFLVHGDDPSAGSFRNSITVTAAGDLDFHLELGPDEQGNFQTIGRGRYQRP
jgi:hypothetical protein